MWKTQYKVPPGVPEDAAHSDGIEKDNYNTINEYS